MWWILCGFLALALSLFLFAQLQPDIPDELAFLRGDNITLVQPAAEPVERQAGRWTAYPDAPGWRVRRYTDGSAEFQTDLDAPLVRNGEQFGAPFLEVTCVNGYVFMGLYSGFAFQAAPDKSTPVAWNQLTTHWPLSSNGMTAYAPNPRKLVATEGAPAPTAITLHMADGQAYKGTANLSGLGVVLNTASRVCQ